MRIRTQFIITMILFGALLVIMAASAIITKQRVEKAGRQEKTAASIAQGASELGYLANDYLIYRESQQLKRWQSRFNSFSAEVDSLRAERPEQQALVANIKANQKRWKEVFDSVASAPRSHAGNPGAALDPEALQVSWSRMAVQTQGLVSDASRLSQLSRQQMDRLTTTRTLLIYVMVVLFGVFLLSSYMLTYRRILKSITALRVGTAVIGAGNLGFTLEEKKNDEIGDLSRAFNRMTSDLKTVTASKADLEREIRERMQAEEMARHAEAEQRLLAQQRQLALDAARMGWWHYDPVTRIASWDNRYGEIFGVSDYQRPNDEILARLHPEDLPGVWAKVEAALDPFNPQPYFAEYRINLPDGSMRWIEAYGIASFEGDGENRRATSFVGTVADITERKQAEDALRQALTETEEARKDLEGFAYSVSHDLRAPLRAIDGFVRILLRDHGGRLDEEAKRKFNVVRENARKMGQLIDDLLQFSRVGRSELKYSCIDMTGLVREVAGETVAADAGDRFDIRVGELPEAYGDRALIKQVMANLISNAVKFSRGNREGPIEIDALEVSGERAYYVKDCGVGFDMRYYDKLFGVFQRLHSEEQFEGTGVGLAIVNRIVQRHGGRVWAESSPGRGAIFYFILPKETQ